MKVSPKKRVAAPHRPNPGAWGESARVDFWSQVGPVADTP